MRVAALGVAVVAAAVLAGAAAAAERFVWHDANGPGSVQYGVPGSDLRSLRIDCDDAGVLSIGGPSFVDVDEGTKVQVRFSSKLGTEVLDGEAVYTGDGLYFSTPATSGSVALRTLIAGQSLRISYKKDVYAVPGAGSAPLLRKLIAECKPKR